MADKTPPGVNLPIVPKQEGTMSDELAEIPAFAEGEAKRKAETVATNAMKPDPDSTVKIKMEDLHGHTINMPTESAASTIEGTETTGKKLKKTAVGQLIIRKEDAVCASCGGNHWDTECNGPLDDEGYLPICPLCNTKEHTLRNCKDL
jgi:hypothetical protein